MKAILQKLKSVIQALEGEHGSLLLFALFLREHALEKWDIVVAASWLKRSQEDSHDIVISKVQSALNMDEMLKIARVVIIDDNDPVMAFFQENCPVTNGGYKEGPREFSLEPFNEKFSFTIKKAYILRCRQP